MTPEELLAMVCRRVTCAICARPFTNDDCLHCKHLTPVQRGIAFLFPKGQIVELRGLRRDRVIMAGLYTDHKRLAADISAMSADNAFKSVYYTLNPVSQAWLDTHEMPLNEYGRAHQATKDADIAARAWLLLDFDPVRPSNTSSTDAELASAKVLMEEVKEYLITQHDWPNPYIATSGNGMHLLYKIDLPNTRASTLLVESVLRALSAQFSNDAVNLDTAVGNAARICKSYGSVTRKGPNEKSRPWRRSGILNHTLLVKTVTPEQLQAVAGVAHDAQQDRSEDKGRSVLDPDFDVEDLIEHFDLSVWNPGGTDKGSRRYYYLDSCPFKGAPHSGTAAKTSLIVGNTLGFHCFSDDCADKGIGDLLRLLSEEHGFYPEPIWQEDEDEEEEEDDDEEEQEEEPSASEDDEAPADTAVVPLPVKVPQPVAYPQIVTATQPSGPNTQDQETEDDETEDFDGFSHESSGMLIDPYLSPGNTDDSPFPFPEQALYGWLGQKTRTLDAPLGWAYPAMLTVFAAEGINSKEELPQPRPTLFTVLMAAPGVGKSVTIDRALATITSVQPHLRKQQVPGSDRGIFKLFATPKDSSDSDLPDTGLLALDELKSLLSKASIMGSSLADTLCTLYYKNRVGSADKTGTHDAHIKLNILGGLPATDESEFPQYFGTATTAGLYSRFVFGVGPSDWEWNFQWKASPEVRRPSDVMVPSLAYRMNERWVREGKAKGKVRGRLGELAMRVAVISASANRDSRVSETCMQAAIAFAEWQETIRERYAPGVAETPEGKITSAIVDHMESLRVDGISHWVKFWDVGRKKNWGKKFGSAAVTRIRAALVEDGTFIEEPKDPDEKPKRGEQKGARYIHLRNPEGVELEDPPDAVKAARSRSKR